MIGLFKSKYFIILGSILRVLEPYKVKSSRTVLKGERESNLAALLCAQWNRTFVDSGVNTLFLYTCAGRL